jgi:hypothetical protein
VWWKGEDREVVGTAQTEEGLLHVCFDGVWEGSVRVGETNVEQLVVEGTGRGEGETTELLRADCRESRCLGCRRITKLVRAWTATVECQRR